MSSRGRLSLVLALDAESRVLALSVGFAGYPALELDLARPSQEGVASLARLAGIGDSGALAFASRAADALAAETVGRRFFRQFRTTLERVAEGLRGPMNAGDRHSLALLQLTRVLFLYFIQTKGWLGRRERFLAEEVDRCLSRRRRIHRDLLRPLFFGTLNQPRELRTRAAGAFGDIPFLNGGLFEPHPMERRLRADVPNHLWRDAFDGLFERFHFTVSETDRGGSVAPDMLGRVFEGVMAPEVRHASGTFYTPGSLVAEMLDAAVFALVAGRLGCSESEAERRLQEGDGEVAAVLTSLTVLDPAVGSGAFLLGALDRLSATGPGTSCSARKRRVLQHNLFGVDQSAAAVRLSELRLWLAVIADDPAERVDDIAPLPNLDCLIRQGDSLFDPIGQHLDVPYTSPRAAELSELRRAVVTASGADKRSLVRRLHHAETEALNETLGKAELRARNDSTDCLHQARGPDLFGQRRGLDRELRARLSQARQKLRTLRQARRRLMRDGEIPWFHYQSHFADVFGNGGFDIVIGNPPWLRSEDIPAEVRGRLTARYRWWRSAGREYGKRPDLSVAFLERAVELAAPGGVVAMLVPAKIASTGYGAAARNALASTTTLHVVADLTGDAVREFKATVYPMALVASKAAAPPRHRTRTALSIKRRDGVLQARLRGGGPWILVRDRVRSVLESLQRNFPRLGDRFGCHLGLKTGANHVFLDPPDDLEAEVLRWAIRGRDLRPFCCTPGTRLLWTHDAAGQPRLKLPPRCTEYLLNHEAELRARRDFTGGPVWTVFRVGPAVTRHRVIWADLARRLVAVALTTDGDLDCVPLNSCYVIAAKTASTAECLAAWLNSTWMRAAARLGAVPAAGGFARFKGQTVAGLPLPAGVLGNAGFARLAQEGRLGADVQAELDQLVAGHLGLSRAAETALRGVVDAASRPRR